MTGESPTFSQFRGRRTARPLRQARAAALEHGLPRYLIELDGDGKLISPLSSSSAMAEDLLQDKARLEWDPRVKPEDDVVGFEGKSETWLEIGFGNGEHLLEQAKLHPEIGLIGCEPFIGGVSYLVKELESEGTTNIRIFTEDARQLLKALPDRSIARCFILFADPWPKKKHNKRRIVNPDTLTDLARVMTADGALFIATDDPSLAEWYAEIVPAHPAWTLHPAAGGNDAYARPADMPATRYEAKALEKGRMPVYYRAIRSIHHD